MVLEVFDGQEDTATRVQEMVDTACRVAVSEGLASSGDILVIAAGMTFK